MINKRWEIGGQTLVPYGACAQFGFEQKISVGSQNRSTYQSSFPNIWARAKVYAQICPSQPFRASTKKRCDRANEQAGRRRLAWWMFSDAKGVQWMQEGRTQNGKCVVKRHNPKSAQRCAKNVIIDVKKSWSFSKGLWKRQIIECDTKRNLGACDFNFISAIQENMACMPSCIIGHVSTALCWHATWADMNGSSHKFVIGWRGGVRNRQF